MSNDGPDIEEIPLAPPGRGTVIFPYLVLIPFIGFLVYLYFGSTDGFAPDKAQAQLPGLLAVAGISVLCLLPISWAVRRRHLSLTATELVIRGGFYSRRLPIASLKLDAAQQVSLIARREYVTRWRTNGIALPGYRVGWFRLRNGDKALVYLSDPYAVTYLPTTAGFVLLLSTTALLPALQARAARAGGTPSTP